ncbi:MAG: MarR family transcriptional regulator [Rhizobacter sp.]|nr:MarR family transcriptional regulator [Chlorobiales bacterium]
MQLKDELKMTQDFRRKSEEAYLAIIVTSSRLTDHGALMHRTRGLTMTQYNILRILRGSHPETLSCSDIMSRTIEKNPDITRLLDRLSEAELITRFRCDEDRRMVKTGITKKGLDLLKKIDKDMQSMQSPIDALTETEQETLITLLEKIRGSIPPLCSK